MFSLGCFSKYNTSLRAVRFPIPGSRDTSLTAFSSSFEEKSIVAKLQIMRDDG